MDPLTRTTAADIEEMAEHLHRIGTGGSLNSPTRYHDSPALHERHEQPEFWNNEPQDQRRKVASSGGFSPSPSQSSYLADSKEVEFGQHWTPLSDYSDPVYVPRSAHSVRTPSNSVSSSLRKDSRSSDTRRPSQSAASYSLYPPSSPPIAKPLPPLPHIKNSRRVSSQGSIDGSDAASSFSASRLSQASRSSNATSSNPDRMSNDVIPPLSSPVFPSPPVHQFPMPSEERPKLKTRPRAGSAAIDLVPWKHMISNDKSTKDPTVFYFDVSTTSATLASKHGNNIIKVWSVGSGILQSTIKFSCYTAAQARSREYFVRSHAILSEPATMMAIATGFGDTLEVWDWAKKKKLQTIEKADRWAAVRTSVYEAGFSPLVTYAGDADTIDLYSVTQGKKPFKKSRTIELRKANLPVIPKYPELAFSATGPLLVAACGPRPPRLGHPPPERETLLVAWDVGDPADDSQPMSHTPYKCVTPWAHTELDTALPSGLATYGSVAVSIWIPASYRAVPVPAARGGNGYNLAPVPVPYRHVLVWDFSASSTKTFRIPNAISCVSPDCRYVAYCDATGIDLGGRGCLVILDAMTGAELWRWPDPDAGIMESGPKPGYEQLEALSKVTELSFSTDGGFLFLGDSDGGCGVYEVREAAAGANGQKLNVRPIR